MWTKVHLEKLIVSQRGKKSHVLYGTQRFVTVYFLNPTLYVDSFTLMGKKRPDVLNIL
jgi:arginine exporter protein ArgO